jgi:hypothetical protein
MGLRNKRRRLGVAALALLSVIGCTVVSDSAQVRAREFVQLLVETPENQDAVLAVADAPAPGVDALVDDLIAEVALNYLRATHHQGVALTYAVDAVTAINENEQVVVIGVDQDQTARRVRFSVRLRKSPDRGWLVTRVSAGT